jgi:hypothetical protein
MPFLASNFLNQIPVPMSIISMDYVSPYGTSTKPDLTAFTSGRSAPMTSFRKALFLKLIATTRISFLTRIVQNLHLPLLTSTLIPIVPLVSRLAAPLQEFAFGWLVARLLTKQTSNPQLCYGVVYRG